MKSPHIDTTTLAYYVNGHLPEEKRQQMEAHLSVCDNCLEEFALANKLLQDEQLLASEPLSVSGARKAWQAIRPMVIKFYKWITDIPAQMPQPAFSPVRSTGSTPNSQSDRICLKKEFDDDLRMEMDFSKTENDTFSLQLKPFSESRAAEKIRLTLKKERGVLCSHLLKDEPLSLQNLSFGSYCITLTENALERGRCDFQINHNGLSEL